MNIQRCNRVVHYESPARAEKNDYFLFKHYTGFWLVLKNTLSGERFQCKTFKDAFMFAISHAAIKGRSLLLSLDKGKTWERHPAKHLKETFRMPKCG